MDMVEYVFTASG